MVGAIERQSKYLSSILSSQTSLNILFGRIAFSKFCKISKKHLFLRCKPKACEIFSKNMAYSFLLISHILLAFYFVQCYHSEYFLNSYDQGQIRNTSGRSNTKETTKEIFSIPSEAYDIIIMRRYDAFVSCITKRFQLMEYNFSFNCYFQSKILAPKQNKMLTKHASQILGEKENPVLTLTAQFLS